MPEVGELEDERLEVLELAVVELEELEELEELVSFALSVAHWV